MMQLTLSMKMTTAQAVEMSVTVNNNSPIQDDVHPADHTQRTHVPLILVIILFILITFPLNDPLLLLREN